MSCFIWTGSDSNLSGWTHLRLNSRWVWKQLESRCAEMLMRHKHTKLKKNHIPITYENKIVELNKQPFTWEFYLRHLHFPCEPFQEKNWNGASNNFHLSNVSQYKYEWNNGNLKFYTFLYPSYIVEIYRNLFVSRY